LGYFNREQMAPEFSKAAFGLKRGAFTTTPVKTQFGWHVIKVEDRRKLKPPKFDDIKVAIREELAQELRAVYVKELRRDADIVRFDQPSAPASGSKKETTKGGAAKTKKSDAAKTKGDDANPLWHKYLPPGDNKAKPADKPK
ncbi:MAG: peptidylprolyl isomerase, partial [Rhodospirillales bacterium]|nr:peptidylprolyl isomerase [Rhodospirillales bacterium]